MAETVDPDVRTWAPETRRIASIWVLVAAGILVIAGALVYGLVEEIAGWFLIALIVALALLLLFEGAVVATGVAREENIGPDWLRGTTHAPQHTAQVPSTTGGAAAAGGQPSGVGEAITEVELKCPECTNLFAVEDTGERPLHIDCPHCGAHGHVDLPPAGPTEGGAPAGPPPARATGGSLFDEPLEDEPAASISLKCPACATQFDVEDTGKRPLSTTCPGCGRSGKLR